LQAASNGVAASAQFLPSRTSFKLQLQFRYMKIHPPLRIKPVDSLPEMQLVTGWAGAAILEREDIPESAFQRKVFICDGAEQAGYALADTLGTR
jgi:hypothetical protein